MIVEYSYDIKTYEGDELEMNWISNQCKELHLDYHFDYSLHKGFKAIIKGEESNLFYFAYEYRKYCKNRDHLDKIFKRKSPSTE
jgi:hypothetical protein